MAFRTTEGFRFFSEVKGTVLRLGGYDSRYGDHRPFSEIKYKLSINQDSVVIVHTTYDYKAVKEIEHYNKNVGLTFRLIVDTLTHDTLGSLRLINYHITR